MADLAPRLWGAPVVSSTVERDALFPTPATHQRVINLESESEEIYDGSAWQPDLVGSAPRYPTLDGESGIVDASFAYGDIRRYGAVTGGTADCTTALRSAALYGRVFIPHGTWKVTSQIHLSVDGTVVSAEPGATIQANVIADDVTLFLGDGADALVIDGLTITGTFPWAVYFTDGSGHRVTNNTISGGTINANGKCGGVYAENVTNVRIEDNTFSGNGLAGLDSGADIQTNNGSTIVTDVWIVNNRCTSSQTVMNICCFNPKGVKIIGNTCTGARCFASTTGAGGYGILVYKTGGILAADVGDNLIQGNRVYTTQGMGINNQSVPRTTIDANHVFDSCTTMTEVSLSVAAIVSESDRGAVTNNTVRNSGKAGIIISGAGSYTRVANNTVSSPSAEGIAVQGALTDVVIEGNLIEDVAGSLAIGTWRLNDYATIRCVAKNNIMRSVGQAVFWSASSDACVIEGNIATDLNDETYIALNQGTNAVVRDNIGNNTHFPEGVGSDRGDADATVVVGRDFEIVLYRTALTVNRTVTLSSTNVKNGARFRIVRVGLGAHTLDVGGLKTIPNSTSAFVDVEYATVPGVGSFWMLTGYGVL